MHLWLWWLVSLACNPPVTVKPDASTIDQDGDGVSLEEDCDDANPQTGSASAWFLDEDGDGFGSGEAQYTCHPQVDYVEVDTDCDDTDPLIHPASPERCDDIDNNCNGVVDESAVDSVMCYVDADGDGFGDSLTGLMLCEVPPDRVTISDDCDDAAPEIHPQADEICDGVDNDCSGVVDDEAIDASLWFIDADGDGYGHSNTYVLACEPPTDHVAEEGDCDDTSEAIHPGAPDDWYDGVDANCDGEDDYDQDGDGYLSAVHGGQDCDDWDASVRPGAFDWVDGIDNNCNGVVDRIEGAEADGSVECPVEPLRRRNDGYVLGDISGDGLADVAFTGVAYYPYDSSDTYTGSVYVFFGPIGGTDEHPVHFTQADMVFHGDANQLGKGLSATVIGDPTGSTPWALALGNSSRPGGGVYVFSAPQAGHHALSSATGILNVGTPPRPQSVDLRMGHQITSLGAFDGDGTPDWAVSAMRDDEAAVNAGAVYLMSGIPSGTGYLPYEANAKLLGESTEDEVGHWMTCLEDVDGDGLSELAVASRARWENGEMGKVYILQSPVSGTVSLSSADLQIYGTETYATGESVGDAGDVDGDGLSDVVVGTPWTTGSTVQDRVYGPGVAALFYSGALGFRMRRPNPFTRFSIETGDAFVTGPYRTGLGHTVDGVGDFDRDGRDDFAVSDVGYRTYLITDALTGWHAVEQVAAAEIWVHGGPHFQDAGDLDGDGFHDLMATGSRQAWIFRGGL